MALRDLSTLFELLPTGAYRASMDGKSVQVNAALTRLNGFASVDEMQVALGDVYSNPYRIPEQRGEFKALLQAQGHVTNFEAEMVRKLTGKTMWTRDHAHIVRDASGAILNYEGTVEDITQERQAMLQNLLQTIPDSVWLKDVDRTYLTCNEAFATACRSTIAAIVWRRDEEWVTYANTNDFRTTDEIVIRHGKPAIFEEEFGAPGSGRSGMHELLKAPMFDSAGHTIGVLGMARKIQQRKLAETQLRETSEKLELAMMGADFVLWEYDLTVERGYFMDATSWAMLGHRGEAPRKGREWGYLVHPQDLPEALAALRTYLTGATETFEAEYRALHANGQWVWISSRGKVVQSRPNGTPMRMAGNLMDVTARKWSEHRLRLAQAELQATLNALPDLLFEVTVDGLYRAVHARDVSLLTAPPAYVIDRSVHELMPSQAAQVWTQALVDAQKTGRSNGRQYSLDLWGQTFWFELSVVRKPTEREEEPRFVAIARDITERKTVGDAIAHLAFHDTLTRLPNRRLSTERLQRAVTSSSRTGQFGALMFIDLDRFKHLNDTHGHEMGDLLLIEVAQRLRVCVREMDTVASLGGDEFVVLIQDLSDSASPPAEYAQAVGRKILDSLGARYMLKELSYESTPITGATLFAAEGLT
jgi:PAS domain S-box-containing protein